jgi:hypothetical protein
MQAILAGGTEQSRMLGEARAEAGFGNQARGQAYEMDMGLTAAENARRAGEAGFRNNAIGAGWGMDTAENQAENARRMGEAEFGRGTVAQNNQAKQAAATIKMAQTEMENARRRGDAAAYNAAKEAYNNATLQQSALNRDKADFNNQSRQAMIAEMTGLQGTRLNQLMALLGGTQFQNPNAPSYQGQGVQAPDYTGMVSDNYAQQVGSYNNRMQAIAGLGKAAVGFLPF